MPPRSRGFLASKLSTLVCTTTRRSSPRPFICNACRVSLSSSTSCSYTSLTTPPRTHHYPPSHPFSTSPPILAKKSKPSTKASNPTPNNTMQKTDNTDPHNYSELESGIATATSRLRASVSKTRHAGRVSPEMLESLSVTLPTHTTTTKSSPSSKSPTPKIPQLSDLATVVPKGGRTLQIFLTDPTHLNPVKSAIQAAPYSLTPTTDQNNSLLLLVEVPPATAETRQQAKEEAKKMLERANGEIRNVRGDAQKRYRKMELDKVVGRDELRKAHEGMEKVVKRGVEEAKTVFEGAVRGLER